MSLRRMHEIPLVPLRARSSSALGARLDQAGEKGQCNVILLKAVVLLGAWLGERRPKNIKPNPALLAPVQTAVGVILFCFGTP